MKPCGLQRKTLNEIPEASVAVQASYSTQCCGAVAYRRKYQRWYPLKDHTTPQPEDVINL